MGKGWIAKEWQRIDHGRSVCLKCGGKISRTSQRVGYAYCPRCRYEMGMTLEEGDAFTCEALRV